MLRKYSTRRIAGLLAVDWFGTLAVLLLASYLRRQLASLPGVIVALARALEVTLGGTLPDAGPADILFLPLQVLILVAILWPFFFVVFAVYDARHNETIGAELRNVFLAVSVATLTLAGMLYFSYRETSRVMVLLFYFLDLGLLLGARLLLFAYSRNGKRAPRQRPVIIVGAGRVGHEAAEQLTKYAWADIELVGFVDDDPTKNGVRRQDLPVLGTLDQLPDVVRDYHVQDAVVALPLRAYERQIEICQQLQKLWVHVHVIPDLFALSFPNATLDGFGGIPVIDLGRPGFHGLHRFSKRAFDLATAGAMLLLLSPLLLLVAALIKLESKGPVIYRQQRIGENGRLFTMFKFRSMRADADPNAHKAYVTRLIEQNLGPEEVAENGGRSLKMEHDPRITRVGRFIRKMSIDELPQLFNVLRGDMSLVGPRPPLPYEADLYRDWHKRRFEALPGITGWWQVKGRNRVSFDEMVRLDLHYIEHASFWLDVRVLLMTPWVVLTGKGAG
jgi:exopolysaccharide biosynthesis polyprenyl glycosylphosphotransferase